MNEIEDSDLEDTDKEKFYNALISLKNEETIIAVNNILSQVVQGKIFICFPKMVSEKDNIHFIVDTEEKFTLFNISSVSVKIEELLGYEGIFIKPKNFFTEESFNSLFDKVTLFSIDNKKEVNTFISEKYPEAFNLKEKEGLFSSTYRQHGMFNGPSNEFTQEKQKNTKLGEKAFDSTYTELSTNKEKIDEADFSNFLTDFMQRASEKGYDPQKIISGVNIPTLGL